MSLSFRIAALAALAAAGVPTGAVAHVTLQPDEAPAGEFKRLDVRVPNERDDASTTKVQLKFPPGFIFVSYQPVAGWQTKLKMAKLDEPVEVFGEKHSEQVDTVTFTAQRTGVAPGQFQDFGLSVALPKRPGATLTFKALQTYSNGEVVRWIGPPGADQPAPQVKLTAAPQQARAAQTTSTASGGGDDDGGDTLAVVALIVGAAGLLAGSMALATARRGSSAATG